MVLLGLEALSFLICLVLLGRKAVEAVQGKKFLLVLLLSLSFVAVKAPETVVSFKAIVGWAFVSDLMVFFKFQSREAMGFAIGTALVLKLFGVLLFYFPIDVIFGKDGKIREFLASKIPWLERHLERVNNFNNGSFSIISSSHEKKKAVAKLAREYRYEYLVVFVLSVLPEVGSSGIISTGAAVLMIEGLEVKFGLAVIIAGKLVKICGLALAGYFAPFL